MVITGTGLSMLVSYRDCNQNEDLEPADVMKNSDFVKVIGRHEYNGSNNDHPATWSSDALLVSLIPTVLLSRIFFNLKINYKPLADMLLPPKQTIYIYIYICIYIYIYIYIYI